MEENFDKDGVDGLLKKHPVAYNHPNKIKEGVIEKVLFFRKDYQLGYKKEVLANDKIAASNASYQTQNCAQSIAFCRSDVDIEKTLTPIAVVSAFNNSGLGYLKLNKPDSAIFFFSKAADFKKRKNWGFGKVLLPVTWVMHCTCRDVTKKQYPSGKRIMTVAQNMGSGGTQL